ncbi:MAG: hypothetical protein E7177_03355 [Erysipelotrichaceae bacterium]|nr:hypothetical protein [Erysipelotrichaceae bacterium]
MKLKLKLLLISSLLVLTSCKGTIITYDEALKKIDKCNNNIEINFNRENLTTSYCIEEKRKVNNEIQYYSCFEYDVKSKNLNLKLMLIDKYSCSRILSIHMYKEDERKGFYFVNINGEKRYSTFYSAYDRYQKEILNYFDYKSFYINNVVEDKSSYITEQYFSSGNNNLTVEYNGLDSSLDYKKTMKFKDDYLVGYQIKYSDKDYTYSRDIKFKKIKLINPKKELKKRYVHISGYPKSIKEFLNTYQ